MGKSVIGLSGLLICWGPDNAPTDSPIEGKADKGGTRDEFR
jgi:hypothetical protein